MPVFLRDLRAELQIFGRNPVKYDRYRLKKLESLAWATSESVMFKAIVQGATDDYATYAQFFDVGYSPEKSERFTEMIQTKEGVLYYEKPSARSHPVALRCSCPDFRFRFSKELYDQGGLIGMWQQYTRKTPPPPTGRPYVNPLETMGFCKHLWTLLNSLKESGRIVS